MTGTPPAVDLPIVVLDEIGTHLPVPAPQAVSPEFLAFARELARQSRAYGTRVELGN
jgi:hypothetical protein